MFIHPYIPFNRTIFYPCISRVYPSQVRRYYYSYYMAYFQPTGLVYARDARDSERTGE